MGSFLLVLLITVDAVTLEDTVGFFFASKSKTLKGFFLMLGKKDYYSVDFTDIQLKFSVVVTECNLHHMKQAP